MTTFPSREWIGQGMGAPSQSWWFYFMSTAGGLSAADGIRALVTGRVAHEGLRIDRSERPWAFLSILGLEPAAGSLLLLLSVPALL